MKRSKLLGFTAVLYIILFVICCASWLWQLEFGSVAAAVTNSVQFMEGTVKKDATEVTIVLHEGETDLLAELTALTRADFTGSDCTAEIVAWAKAHPAVSVSYDVPLPNGERAASNASSLTISDVNETILTEYTTALEYLPNVSTVELVSGDGGALPADTLAALIVSRPDIAFTYSFNVAGIDCALDMTELDLTTADAEAVAAVTEYLPCLTKISSVALGDESTTKLTWEDIAAVAAECPAARLDYAFTLYGKSVTLADEVLDLSRTEISDNGDALMAALPAMKNLKSLDMDDGGVVAPLSNERMQEIRDAAPNAEVNWRIWFGALYSIRTDETRLLASKPSVGGMVDNVVAAKLKYCTKLKYVDLGHNDYITDLSFVESMPDLEVFIIAMNPVSDLTPLSKCTKLEYLEIFTTNVTDLSPLSGLTTLRHLNISNLPGLTDISPIYTLTELERLWIGTKTPIPAEQIAQMQQAAPGCKISTVSSEEQGDAWRYTWYDENNATYHWVERHEKLREQLGYNYQEYSFYWLDPKCALPTPAEYVGVYYGNPNE